MHPLRRAWLALLIVSLACLTSCGQYSKTGSFHGKTYSDSYFKIAFDLPPFLSPRPVSSLNIHANDTEDAWIMAVARENAEPFGIITISQHLQPRGIVSAKDYLRRVHNSHAPSDVDGETGHKVNENGITFDWLDWKTGSGERNSAVIAQRGDYLIVSRCNAKNDEELELMKDALFGMRVSPK